MQLFNGSTLGSRSSLQLAYVHPTIRSPLCEALLIQSTFLDETLSFCKLINQDKYFDTSKIEGYSANSLGPSSHFLFAAALVVLSNEFAMMYHEPKSATTISSAISVMTYCSETDPQASRLVYILTHFQQVVLKRAKKSPPPGAGSPYAKISSLWSSSVVDPIASLFAAVETTRGHLAPPESNLNGRHRNTSGDRSVSSMSVVSQAGIEQPVMQISPQVPPPKLNMTPIVEGRPAVMADVTVGLTHSLAGQQRSFGPVSYNLSDAQVSGDTEFDFPVWGWPVEGNIHGVDMSPHASIPSATVCRIDNLAYSIPPGVVPMHNAPLYPNDLG